MALPVPAAARNLDGDWLGFAVTAIHLGFMVPVFEQMTVRNGRADQIGWTFQSPEWGCTGTRQDARACAQPVPLGAVVLTQQGDRIDAQPDGPQSNPYSHPTDAGFWPVFRLAGYDWHLRGNDIRLILSRVHEVEGETLTLERMYLRAPPGAAGMAFDYLLAADLSVSRAVCGLVALQDSPADWAAFWEVQARVHPVTAEIRRISLLEAPSREDIALLILLRDGNDPGNADASQIPAAARAAWLETIAVIRQGIAPDPHRALIESLRFPAQAEIARRADACIEYFYSY
jgi:hypothetical protein